MSEPAEEEGGGWESGMMEASDEDEGCMISLGTCANSKRKRQGSHPSNSKSQQLRVQSSRVFERECETQDQSEYLFTLDQRL